MEDKNKNIESLHAEIASLREELQESNGMINAIRNGDIDALVLNKNGASEIYSLQTADYTFRLLIEKISQGALSISRDGLILFCNEHFALLVGSSCEKVTGNYLSEFLSQPDHFIQIIESLKYGVNAHETFFKAASGQKIPVQITLTDLEPGAHGIGIIVIDLTEKKKHENALIYHQKILENKVQELNSINKNLEEFIHVISHDLKEPLRKILMYSDRINDENLQESDAKAIVTMKSSAARLNSLVDDLVSYSSHTMKEEFSKVNVVEIISEVITDYELIINDKKAVIQVGELPELYASKGQIRQLFSNLISNAIKYSREDTTPIIKITEVDRSESDPKNNIPSVKIEIKDNGIGMEKNHLTKIFTIFQRLHAKNQYSGNGIGLAICKKIMENHSGYITVDSLPNQGTTFNLYFPAAQ
ncbi:sensor histidine kinase [Flavobacterium hungaricum]|uniref:histidine kinase n=1 Tax=Flavobacterium hungaricum TaxID=2082725 RepID=A0ABR9TKW3_9FLAO|nr:ATP-binding protein [Flavobacterium hungaricum]MBE8725950.1 PAS domain S-box protein [Flavobacterium hungaricum]